MRKAPNKGGKLLNHGEGSLMLNMDDEASARLAVDVLARLCQFATGSAGSAADMAELRATQPLHREFDPVGDFPRRAESAFWQLATNWILMGGAGAALIGLGFVLGLLAAGWTPGVL